MATKNSSASRLIVSFTSFPARIQIVPLVVEELLNQTRLPDRICLYLSKEQFPQLEKDLPEELLGLQKTKKINITFVEDDLKGHKKYYYAMQEFADDIIVTVDDDLIYPEQMLEQLYQSYLRYPKAISTCRAHYMVMQDGIPTPYRMWLSTSDECVNLPSMQLFATGGAGCLYPPHIFDSCRDILFDKNLIKEFCLYQDDIWLKVAELLAKVPVVLVAKHQGLKYIPDTQEVGLWNTVNKTLSQSGKTPNDDALEKLISWANKRFGKRTLLSSLYLPEYKPTELTEEKKYEYYHKRIQNAQVQANKAYGEKRELNTKLQKVVQQNRELSGEANALQDKYKNIMTENQKKQDEIISLKKKIKGIQNERDNIRYDFDQMQHSVSFRVGRKITWLPRKIRDLFNRG